MTNERSRTGKGCRILLLCLVGLACAGVAAAEGDIIRLRTGEVIKGVPRPERSNELTLVVEDAVSGNLRRVAWEAVSPKDAARLRVAWGYEAPALEPVRGVRIRLKLDGGMTTEVTGVVVKQADGHIELHSHGRMLRLERGRIHALESTRLDPRDVWTPRQLVTRFVQALPDTDRVGLKRLTTAAHLRCARFAESVGAYAEAREHYEAVTRDDATPHAAFARERLQGVAVQAERVGWLREVRQIRQAIQLGSFRSARERLAKVRAAIPAPTGSLARQLELAEKKLAEERSDTLTKRVRYALPRAVERLIAEKLKGATLDLSAAVSWARRDLEQATFLEVARSLQAVDDVSLTETRAFWDQRRRGAWRTASYGSGSFILAGRRPSPPRRQKGPRLPKPPTSEGWWARQDRKTRASWLTAYFAEHSGLFEVGEGASVACSTCAGSGLEKHRLQNGAEVTFLCRRCAGVRFDRVVRYR